MAAQKPLFQAPYDIKDVSILFVIVAFVLIIAAIVTPPDVITQIILFSVVYSLYEISILLVKLVEKKKEEALQQMDENI